MIETLTPAQLKARRKPKRGKFGNKKVKVEGMTFDSMKEYRRWIELNILQKAGEIFNLKHHEVFDLGVCKYESDFSYWVRNDNIITVEDVKSPPTRKLSTYRIKKKLMQSVHGITIKEI